MQIMPPRTSAGRWDTSLQRSAWAVAVLCLIGLGWQMTGHASEPATVIPPPALDAPKASTPQTIVLAGGCFWGVQAVFQHVKGVTNAVSGIILIGGLLLGRGRDLSVTTWLVAVAVLVAAINVAGGFRVTARML